MKRPAGKMAESVSAVGLLLMGTARVAIEAAMQVRAGRAAAHVTSLTAIMGLERAAINMPNVPPMGGIK